MFKKLASVVIGAVLLVSPSVSSAQTLAELQAQVMALLAQLSALQAQINAQVSGNPNLVLTNAPTPTVTTNGGTTLIEFKMVVRITNLGSDDMHIPLYISSQADNGKGAAYKIIDNLGNIVTPINSASSLVRISGGAETMCGSYECVRISGMTSTDLQMTVTASFANLNQAYRAQLTHILWQTHTGTPSGTTVPLSSEYTTPLSPTNSTTSTITIISPNGSEQWEIGQLNTITWTPYAYTPSFVNAPKDVSVYLQRTDGTTVGKVMDTGKASLHTYFNIDTYEKWATPGQYYVYIKNNVTGASDRSDAPFTLLPRSVDLKVNGSDSGVTVSDNQPITLSWATANYTFPNKCTLSGVRTTPSGDLPNISVSANGSGLYYAYAPFADSYSSVRLSCVDGAKGLEHTDYVSLKAKDWQQQASLKVLSPNGGESIDPTKQWYIKAHIVGLKTLSLALYKNDQWLAWLMKDISTAGQPGNFEWVHGHTPIGETYPELKNGSDAIYKIYATGLKADGTGYVDDKSDMPFSFSSSVTPSPSTTAKGIYQGYLSGKLFITTKDITETDALENCKKNANNNPKETIRCTWKDREIYKRDGVSAGEKEKSTYRGYMNGLLFIETKDITETDALANCKVNDKNNPNESILCVWKDKEIYRRSAPSTVVPSVEKGTLTIRLNGLVTATVTNITQVDALARCKAAANNSPEKTARCTWNNADIYNRDADTSKKPTCTLKANPATVASGGSTTLTWVTTYADWVKLDDGKTDYGSVNKDGSRVFTNIKKDTTFTLRVDGKERVNCTKTVKVSTSSSMGETENLASAAAALEAALQVILSLIPEEQ